MVWDLIPAALMLSSMPFFAGILFKESVVSTLRREWLRTAVIGIPCVAALAAPWIITALIWRWNKKNGLEYKRWSLKHAAESSTPEKQVHDQQDAAGMLKKERRSRASKHASKKPRAYHGRWAKRYQGL
jgi:hypothetical protein